MMTLPIVPIVVGAFLALVGATLVGRLAISAGFPMPPEGRRIGCIDGLRGYLALAVLVHHFVIWIQVTKLGGMWEAPTIFVLNNLGAGSVALFFMTTGLVFYPSILRGFRKTRWIELYINRIFRILPLVSVSFLIVTLVVMARTDGRPNLSLLKSAAQWITAWGEPPLLGYLDAGRVNAYVLWSLWYEWIFYVLVLPASAIAMDLVRRRLPSWAVPLALLIVFVIARYLVVLRNLELHGLQKLPQYGPLFAIGMLAYEVQTSPLLKRCFQTPAATVLAAVALATAVTSARAPYAIPQMSPLAFFFVTVACGNSFAGLLRRKGALALGECSFGLYLLHGIALNLIFVDAVSFIDAVTTDQAFVVLPVVAIMLVAITACSYLLIERPMIAAGRRIARSVTNREIG